MVYLFLCQACEKGDHKNCSKGHPAPPGVYGGSKCKCFDLSHNYTPTDLEKLEKLEFDKKCNKIDETFKNMIEGFNKCLEN